MADANNVVPLPGDAPVHGPPPPSPPGRMHGSAIAGMGVSAIVGIAAMLAFITVTWPERIARLLIVVCLIAGLTFMTCAALAVFTAARDTYRNGGDAKADD